MVRRAELAEKEALMAETRVKKIGSLGYDPNFANEVFANVDSAEEIKTCMQCGVCAASCPLSMHMEFPPRKIFAAIRAGARERVLGAKETFLCTSCYSCKVRCPRNIRVIDVMHGLAHYSIKLGYVNAKDPIDFGKAFWGSIEKLGRIDESMTPVKYMMADGVGAGIKKMLEFKNMGITMLKHRRMKLLPERPIKGIKGMRKMLEKAAKMSAEGKGGKA